MRRRTSILRSLLLLPLLAAAGLAVPTRAAGAPSVAGAAGMRGVPSRELLAIAEQALAGAAAAVRGAPGWMGSAHSRQAPVAAALSDMQSALARIRPAWAARSPELPRAIRRGSVALAALRVAWVRSGVAAPQAGRRLRILAAAYDALRARHGPEAARLAHGAGMTPAEAAQLRRLQRASAGLPPALGPLGARAAAAGERALAAELERWVEQSERLAAAEPSLEALLAAIWLADQLAGEWRAAAPALAAAGGADLHAADEAVREVLGESEVGYVLVADLGPERKDGEDGESRAGDGGKPGGEIAVFEPVAQDAEGEGRAVLGRAGAEAEAREDIAWEDQANAEGAVVEWEQGALDWPGGEDSWWDAEEGWEAVAPGSEEEGGADAAAPDDVAPADATTPAAEEPAAPAETIDPTSFEVVTDSGEILVVEIGPDGTLTTRPKQPAPPVPASPTTTPPVPAQPASTPAPPASPEPPLAPPQPSSPLPG